MDIIGPFKLGKGQCKFLLVGIDYFTKWREVELLTTITARNVRNFVWKNIICRFGIPHVIIIITRYSLTYGSKDMILVKVGEPSLRHQLFDIKINEESLLVGLKINTKFGNKILLFK